MQDEVNTKVVAIMIKGGKISAEVLKKALDKFVQEIEKAQKQMQQPKTYRGKQSMALGVDRYAAEIVLDLKARYPSITLESAIPCETQAVKWSMAQRERYYDIAAQCDKETMLQSHYSPDCMDKRNRYMVDHADFIIAVWDGRPSGTGKTVTYARGRNGKSIIVIDPVTLAIERL